MPTLKKQMKQMDFSQYAAGTQRRAARQSARQNLRTQLPKPGVTPKSSSGTPALPDESGGVQQAPPLNIQRQVRQADFSQYAPGADRQAARQAMRVDLRTQARDQGLNVAGPTGPLAGLRKDLRRGMQKERKGILQSTDFSQYAPGAERQAARRTARQDLRAQQRPIFLDLLSQARQGLQPQVPITGGPNDAIVPSDMNPGQPQNPVEPQPSPGTFDPNYVNPDQGFGVYPLQLPSYEMPQTPLSQFLGGLGGAGNMAYGGNSYQLDPGQLYNLIRMLYGGVGGALGQQNFSMPGM